MPKNRSLRAKAGLLVLALGAGGPAFASSAAGRDGSEGRASVHFRVRTEQGPKSDRLERETLTVLENWHKRFLIIFEAEPPSPLMVRLHPARSFHAETGAPTWADGVYAGDGAIQVAVGGLAKVDGPLERVLAHELAHAFITHLSAGHAPAWLQEGLAQALTRVEPSDPAPAKQPAATPDELDYDGALEFTRTLLAGAGPSALRDVLADLGAGSDLSPAFEHHLGAPLSQLFAGWRSSAATLARDRAEAGRR